MKTSILYGTCTGPQRACLPCEVTDEKSALIRKGRFLAKGTSLGTDANGKPWLAEHDQIVFSGYSFYLDGRGNVKGWPHRGADRPPCDAKVIDAEFVEQLHAIDEQFAALSKQRRAVMEDAWQRGRKLNKRDIAS